jgi:hypothetical protein
MRTQLSILEMHLQELADKHDIEAMHAAGELSDNEYLEIAEAIGQQLLEPAPAGAEPERKPRKRRAPQPPWLGGHPLDGE